MSIDEYNYARFDQYVESGSEAAEFALPSQTICTPGSLTPTAPLFT
ncbi:MAG: hypothetical protein ACRDZM_13410 [Acidimicrobiia bacterium]